MAIAVPLVRNRFDIEGIAPEIRFIESDQISPAGEFRLIVSGDRLIIQRNTSGDYITGSDIINAADAEDVIVAPYRMVEAMMYG